MSNTKIVLNRQSDLILDNAEITAPVGIVLADIAGATDAISAEESLRVAAVAAEESSRIAGDAELTADLSVEAAARVASDEKEVADRIAGDASVTAAMSAEISTRVVAETSLQNNIDAEASTGLVRDNAEASTARAAEQSLATDLDAEQSRAESAEASLDAKVENVISNIDPTALDSLTEIVSAFQSADGDINGAITALGSAATVAVDNEASIRLAADQSLAGDLSSEIADREAGVSLEEAARISGDASLTADLSAEVEARISDVDAEQARAESATISLFERTKYEIGMAIDGEQARAESAEDVLTADLSAEVEARISDVDAEESRAIEAEGSIATDLGLNARGTEGDYSWLEYLSYIDGTGTYTVNSFGQPPYSYTTEDFNIEYGPANLINFEQFMFNLQSVGLSDEASRVRAAISIEESRAMSAEAVLTSDLSTEVSSRIADVDAEESRAMSAEAVLTSDLSAEVSARAAAVSTETSARIAAVDAEYSRANDAEAVLTSDLSDEVANRIDAVSTEEAARIAGDANLQNQIDNVLSNVDGAALDSLTEIVSAFQSADGDINGAITALASTATSGLSTEVARAESVEESLAAAKLNLAGGTMSGDIDMGSNNITELNAVRTDEVSNRDGDIGFYWDNGNANFFNINQLKGLVDAPTDGTDATNKLYVDNADASIATDLSAEASRAIEAEGELTSDLSTEVSAREAAISAEESMRVEADASIAAELSSDIEALADVDGTTIVLNTGTNQIELAEEVAAPASGIRTLMGEIDIETILKVGGVDVMAEISSEISRAEAAEASIAEELSTEVSYLIANTDLGSIDSFAEIVSDLSSEVARAESAEVSIDTAVNNLSTNTEDYVIEMMPRIHGVNESPDGTIVAFTADVIAGSAVVFLNGLMLTAGEDYTPTYVAHLDSFTFDFISTPAATDRINVYGVHFGTTFNGVNA